MLEWVELEVDVVVTDLEYELGILSVECIFRMCFPGWSFGWVWVDYFIHE